VSIASNIVKRPVLGLVVFALIAIVAAFLVGGIPIDLNPEVSPPYLMVRTGYNGAGPETVENSVTRILESQLVNINGLKNISSTSSEGSSTISLEFDFGTNIEAKVNDARDRLDRVKRMLPDGADTPVIMQMDVNAMPIMRLVVGGNRSNNELQTIANDIIVSRLEQVDGVASVDVTGGVIRQVRVEISQNRLEAYGLTITGIAGTLASQNLELGAGSIVDGSRNFSIRTTGEFDSVQDIAQTVIARRGDADVRLIDIAEVGFGYPEETSAAYINGDRGVFVSVTKQSGTNSVEVADLVYLKMDEIRRLLPADITFEIIQDNTTMIRDMMDGLVNSALMGAVLAMAILFLFLRNVKSTVIIAISIPFSLLVTLLVMSLAGLTLNMLTMIGLILGVGLVTDCSIVVIENIFKYRERGTKPTVAATLGSQEVITSIFAATLTTLCVFIPILLFKNQLGFIGMMVQDMIITVAISIASSLFIAIFLVPILASKYLPLYTRTQKPLHNRLISGIDRIIDNAIKAMARSYASLLKVAVGHRLITVLIVVALFVASLLTVPRLGMVNTPPMNEDSVSISVQLPLGTVYEDTNAVMMQLQDIALNEINGIKSLVMEVRQSSGALEVVLDMNTPGADTSEQVRNKLRSRFGDFPNATIGFGRGMGGMMGGADIQMVLRINDIDEGLATAQAIRELILEKVPQVSELSIDMTEGLPQVDVIIDRNRAYNLGLSVSGIAREIAAAMNGVTATTFRQTGSEYSVVLGLREEDRQRLPDLERIFVAANTGNLIPVSNFASLDQGLGPVSIRRQNQSRVITITGSIASGGGTAQSVEQKIKDAMDANFILPDGIMLSYEGQARETSQNTQVFLVIIVLAIILVFGTMAGIYESFKDPFINMFAIPLVLIGIVGIHLIVGQSMSMFTMIGLVMLVGIVTNNGIILVDYTNLLVGRGLPVRQACIEAGEARLRPVLITALTTILGLVPIAFFPSNTAVFIQPIGLTVIGGLVSATFITLFFLPVLYSLLNEHRGKKAKHEAKEVRT
jgi:HAE1 family hydrophobic/amphiphilic exporter-1